MSSSKDFYRAFEDRYRGSRELIKQRLQSYSPYLQLVQNQLPGGLALDLGCGRGEWLEILSDCGMAALGVDLDAGMLAACQERKLNARQGDALAHLKSAPTESLALVSAFHLVEHIGFDALGNLVADALRALQPGGILILETPNPENPNVGATTFFRDPTHDKPIPPELLSFLCDHTGFEHVRILRLQTAPHLIEGAQPTIFDVITGSSADYAIVAQKSGGVPEGGSILDIPVTPGFSFHELCTTYSQKTEDRYEKALHDVSEELRQIHAQSNLQISLWAETRRLSDELQSVRAEADSARRGQDAHINNMEQAIGIKNARIQELDEELNQRDVYIRQLERKLYGVSAGKHLYRALLVILRRPAYRRFAVKRCAKNYQTLNAPWHTHLYRMLLCLRYDGQVSWHTHGARAFHSLTGHRRYRTLRAPRGLTPGHDIQRILFSPDQTHRKILLPPDAETLLQRMESKRK